MRFRPEDYSIGPFQDATPWLSRPETLRNRAQEFGYLYFPGLVPSSRIAALREFVRDVAVEYGWAKAARNNPPFLTAAPGAHMERRPWKDHRFVELQRRLGRNEDFQAVGQYGPILDVLETLYGEPAWMAMTNYCWLKLPGNPEHTTLPHQDRYYLPDCTRLWTGWFPLAETSFEVGPLGLIPASHKKGLWPHRSAMSGIRSGLDVPWASSEVHPGDVVLFNGLTVHGAWSNVSPDRIRASLDVRYEPQPQDGLSILRPEMAEDA
jgi:ectoine hydroxylase-related dioxygenase (phytanoyl-CoA dioxygenase family)